MDQSSTQSQKMRMSGAPGTSGVSLSLSVRGADRMGAKMATRNKIFVSYSHKDGRLFEDFKTMMAPAIQNGIVDLWDDQKIPPGARWKEEIEQALASASIAVLLVSQNFLASPFIAEKELPPLLTAARDEGATIFWIYLSSCLFERTEIASYQAAHDISKPLDRLSKSQRQAVLSETCAKLIRAAELAAPLEPTRMTLQAVAAAAHTRSQQSEFLRSPWLGIEIWQAETRSPLVRGGPDVIRAYMKREPFEIRIPTASKGGSVMITASYESSIFEQIKSGMTREQVPFFASGTGMADSSFGIGELWVEPEGHMHLDWGGRLLPRPEGGGTVLFHSLYRLDEEPAGLPNGKDVFVVVHVPDPQYPNEALDNDNFERFILSF